MIDNMDGQADNSTQTRSRRDSWNLYTRQLRIILAHVGFFSLSLFLSFTVEDGMAIGDWFPGLFFRWLLITLAVKLFVFGMFHQYQGWWRYASISDILSIIKASHISTVILVLGWYTAVNITTVRSYMDILQAVPIAVVLMDVPVNAKSFGVMPKCFLITLLHSSSSQRNFSPSGSSRLSFDKSG